jgi:hypothetical protein
MLTTSVLSVHPILVVVRMLVDEAVEKSLAHAMEGWLELL